MKIMQKLLFNLSFDRLIWKFHSLSLIISSSVGNGQSISNGLKNCKQSIQWRNSTWFQLIRSLIEFEILKSFKH